MSNYLLSLIGVLGLCLGLIVIITIVATEFHERSHWAVARVWTNEVNIDRWRGFLAKSVIFHKPFDLPTNGMRLAGFAPALFGFIVGTSVFSIIDAPFAIRLLIALPFWASILLSPSDLLAVVSPRQFQKFAAENDSAGHIEMIKILLEELR